MRKVILLLFSIFTFLTGSYTASAQTRLELPMTYGESMVLQRKRPITLHGRAPGGATVTVLLQGKGRTLRRTARANASGVWGAVLPALPASGPYTLKFSCGNDVRTFSDVWVGEVWLCSGQSNMELPLQTIATAKEDLAVADTLTRVHLLNMPSPWPIYKQVWSTAMVDSIDRGLLKQTGAWTRCSAQTARNFSAIGFHFGRVLADSLGIHVGLINNAVGGSTAEGWIDSLTLAQKAPEIITGDWRRNKNIMEWARTRADYNLQKADTSRPHRHPYAPAFLYDAAVKPLEGYTFRGVLWYQGESNAELSEEHEKLFPLLEDSWRRTFHNPLLPFYTVQLSGISTRPSWPAFRDSQRRLAERLPNTWMTVCSDLGDSLDVHPRRKAPVGERLARQVLHNAYGLKSLVPQGPTVRSATADANGTVTVQFEWGEGMHADGDRAIEGFELCGENGLWHKASVQSVTDGALTLSCQAVKIPRQVRYAWQPYPHANLVNAQNLPCSTFLSEVE